VAGERPFVPPYQRRRQLPEAGPAASAVGGGKSPYALGKAFEMAIKGRLERRGYFVMRAAASKGKVDLLAVGPACVERGISALMIQCKRRGQISSAEWNEVYEIGAAHGGWPVVTMRLSKQTVGFYRLDALREPRRPGRPWTMFDPRDLSELVAPPTLLD
jgi:Holliday junction resolvase